MLKHAFSLSQQEGNIYLTWYTNEFHNMSLKFYLIGQTLQWPKENEQAMIYKTLHRKLKIEQQEPN
jgi:hypothetical protein